MKNLESTLEFTKDYATRMLGGKNRLQHIAVAQAAALEHAKLAKDRGDKKQYRFYINTYYGLCQIHNSSFYKEYE